MLQLTGIHGRNLAAAYRTPRTRVESSMETETTPELGEPVEHCGRLHFRPALLTSRHVLGELPGQTAPENLKVLNVGSETTGLTRTSSNKSPRPV